MQFLYPLFQRRYFTVFISCTIFILVSGVLAWSDSPGAQGVVDSQVDPYQSTLENVQPASRSTHSSVYRPIADTTIDFERPYGLAGFLPHLKLETYPQNIAYLQFEVSDIPANSRAFLYLYAQESRGGTISVYSAGSDWLEGGLLYEDGPPLEEMIAQSHFVHSGSWHILDVTHAHTMHSEATIFTLALITDHSEGIRLSSREDPSSPLIVYRSDGMVPPMPTGDATGYPYPGPTEIPYPGPDPTDPPPPTDEPPPTEEPPPPTDEPPPPTDEPPPPTDEPPPTSYP